MLKGETAANGHIRARFESVISPGLLDSVGTGTFGP